MTAVRWDDPRLLRIGKQFADEAYDLADNLNSYGADATACFLSDEQQYQRSERMNHEVCIPVAFADALMALLLSLPRKGNRRGRRSVWSMA